MLDVTFIRDNPDIVRAAIKNKKGKQVDIDKVLELYDKRKALSQKIDELNKQRNEAQAARDIETGKRLKEEHVGLEAEHAEIEKELVALLIKIPNIPTADTPVGEDEAGNKVLRQIGDKPTLASPKQHFEIGEALGLIDIETAGEVSGARFAYLKGDLAMMQYALFNLVIKILTDEETLKGVADRAGIKVSTKPFTPIVPPLTPAPPTCPPACRSGFGCWLSGVDVNTQQSFEQLHPRAVAVVVDPIQARAGGGERRWGRSRRVRAPRDRVCGRGMQRAGAARVGAPPRRPRPSPRPRPPQSVKGKVVIDAFRCISPQ